MTTTDNGPFESQRQAADSVRSIYDAMHASTLRGVMAEKGHKLLETACTTAGVTVGAYDHRVLTWLAGFEPEMCAVIAGLITRAGHAQDDNAGLGDADKAAVREILRRFRENLETNAYDVHALAAAIDGPPGRIRELADQLAEWDQ
jgi:hypothetical protein